MNYVVLLMIIVIIFTLQQSCTSTGYESYKLLPTNHPYCKNSTGDFVFDRTVEVYKMVTFETSNILPPPGKEVYYKCAAVVQPMGKLTDQHLFKEFGPVNLSFWFNRMLVNASFKGCKDSLVVAYQSAEQHTVVKKKVVLDCNTKLPQIIWAPHRKVFIYWYTQGGVLPGHSSIRIHVSLSVKFEENYHFKKKKKACDLLYFWWCGDEVQACLPDRMRCDDNDDCFDGGSDELNCPVFNNTKTPRDPHDHKEGWTSNLPWIALGILPVVLLFALARICSQKRQLEISDDYKMSSSSEDALEDGPVHERRPGTSGPRDSVSAEDDDSDEGDTEDDIGPKGAQGGDPDADGGPLGARTSIEKRDSDGGSSTEKKTMMTSLTGHSILRLGAPSSTGQPGSPTSSTSLGASAPDTQTSDQDGQRDDLLLEGSERGSCYEDPDKDLASCQDKSRQRNSSGGSRFRPFSVESPPPPVPPVTGRPSLDHSPAVNGRQVTASPSGRSTVVVSAEINNPLYGSNVYVSSPVVRPPATAKGKEETTLPPPPTYAECLESEQYTPLLPGDPAVEMNGSAVPAEPSSPSTQTNATSDIVYAELSLPNKPTKTKATPTADPKERRGIGKTTTLEMQPLMPAVKETSKSNSVYDPDYNGDYIVV